MRSIIALVVLAAVAACTTARDGQDPQLRFFEALRSLCGRAFEGRVVTADAADRELAASRLVMHVRTCSDDEIRIPFHVGEDRSRIWVIGRTVNGLRLKHDHRHRDGSEDVRTQYGGDTVAPGTARRQEFPADRFSRELFVREGIAASTSNVWAIEVEPRRMFAYELRRPNRHFRAEFDLTRPVEPPPPPWGADAR